MVYSSKQNLFLIVYQVSGISSSFHEVVLYWEQADSQTIAKKGSSLKGNCFWKISPWPSSLIYFSFFHVGRDVAFVGPTENQYAILHEDKMGLSLYPLPSVSVLESSDNNGALDAASFSESKIANGQRSLRLSFEADVDRIFSTPLGMSNNDLIHCFVVDPFLKLF